MHYSIEIENTSLKVVIITPYKNKFIDLFKNKLQNYDVDVYATPDHMTDLDKYDIYFFIDEPRVVLNELAANKDKKFIFLFFKHRDIAETYSSFVYDQNVENIKVLFLETFEQYYEKDIETVLWFAFSRSADSYLHIFHEKPYKKTFSKKKSLRLSLPSVSVQSLREPKSLAAFIITIFIFIHLLFIPFLGAASFLNYKAAMAFEQKDIPSTQRYLKASQVAMRIHNPLYRLASPTLHLFTIAFYTNTLVQLNESAITVMSESMEMARIAGEINEALFLKNKSDQEVQQIKEKQNLLFSKLSTVQDHIDILKETFPTWTPQLAEVKTKLHEVSNGLVLAEQFENQMPWLMGEDEERKYLLLFANNMELRPGGGFIGSFGIINVHDYTVEDIQVYDVYDADGQLTEQIDPPAPLVDYLNQTHYFLRDSAFSADFVENVDLAETFLEKEINETDFDGSILITTTAIENILASMDAIYVPDYQEVINKDNFYIKTQLYAEDEFFPGSIQKKRFIASLMNQLLLNLGKASPETLLAMMQQSLDEKQITIFMKNPALQTVFEENYWAGRLLKPQCNLPTAINCILDFVFPLDANLGVNKANYFIQRPVILDVNINPEGTINNTITMSYSNNSYDDVFPGGRYKNYFQILLPPNSRINEITVDDVEIDEYDSTNIDYRTIGFLVEVPPQETKIVKVEYTLPTTIISGEGIYQLIFQKQIGYPNSELELNVHLPDNISVVSKNFSPLVKDNKINYNTTISSDKIFLIEFLKQ